MFLLMRLLLNRPHLRGGRNITAHHAATEVAEMITSLEWPELQNFKRWTIFSPTEVGARVHKVELQRKAKEGLLDGSLMGNTTTVHMTEITTVATVGNDIPREAGARTEGSGTPRDPAGKALRLAIAEQCS